MTGGGAPPPLPPCPTDAELEELRAAGFDPSPRCALWWVDPYTARDVDLDTALRRARKDRERRAL